MSNDASDQQAEIDLLMNLINRWESIDNEMQVLKEDQKTLTVEIKNRGYNTKMFKQIIKDRQRDMAELMEEIDLLEQYRRMTNVLPQEGGE